MTDIGMLAFELISTLVIDVVKSQIKLDRLEFIQRRKIEQKLERSLLEATEQLLPFLEKEGVPREKQQLVFEVMKSELGPLVERPERLFQGSLSGQRIFDELYEDGNLPQSIVEEGLEEVYELLCPQVATLLCEFPLAVGDWENQAWSENFRRFDDIVAQLRALQEAVYQIKAIPAEQADELLMRIRRSLAQRIRLEVEITGLRPDTRSSGQLDRYFVSPLILSTSQIQAYNSAVIGASAYMDGYAAAGGQVPAEVSSVFDRLARREDELYGFQDLPPEALTSALHLIDSKVDSKVKTDIPLWATLQDIRDTVIESTVHNINRFSQPYSASLVIAPAGAGKSTWTAWLQQEALTRAWEGLCIRVELRNLSVGSLPSVHELVRQGSGIHFAEELTAERIGHWLANQDILFILDGFDEISPANRDVTFEWITELFEFSRGCPLVLTSRPLATDHFDELDDSWTEWRILPFNENRIIEYIWRWYQSAPFVDDTHRDISHHDLARVWRSDPTIQPLTVNPLLLSTLLSVNYLDGALPSGRSELYRRYITGMLGEWDTRRRVSDSTVRISLKDKMRILQRLALRMFLLQTELLEESAILDLLKEILDETEVTVTSQEVLAILSERSGLVVGPGNYEFVHKTIMEYLVADAVLQGDQRDTLGNRIDRFYLFEQRGDDRWNTVTFLWAGLASVAELESFIRTCLEAQDWDLAYGLLKDQYKNFTADMRRALLEPLLSAKEIPIGRSRAVGMGIPISADIYLILPDRDLIGMAYWPTLSSLIATAVLDDTLTVSDFYAARSETTRILLWEQFSKRTSHIDTWKALQSEPLSEEIDRSFWTFYAIQLWVERALALPVPDGQLNAFLEACPEYHGLLAMAIIDLVVNQGPAYASGSGSVPDRILHLLSLLPLCKGAPVPDNVIRETNQWRIANDWAQLSIATPNDLLEHALKCIEMLKSTNLASADSILDDSAATIGELLERRSAVLAEPD